MPQDRQPDDGDDAASRVALELAFAHFCDPLVLTEPEGRILWCNAAFEELTGHALAEIRGSASETLHAERGPVPGRESGPDDCRPFDIHYARRNGAVVATESIRWPVCSPDGQPVCHATISRDVTERNRLDAARHRYISLLCDQRLSEGEKIDAILSLACDLFNMPVALVSAVEGDVMSVVHSRSMLMQVPRGTRFDLSRSICRKTLSLDRPFSLGDSVGLGDSIEIGENPAFMSHGLRAYIGMRLKVGEQAFGTLSLCSPLVRPPVTHGESELILLFASGIEQLLATEMRLEQLENAATQDWLTGAVTNRQFRVDLENTFAKVRRNSSTASLILIDIDHFKSINDQFGHDVGDTVLVEIAQRARKVLGPKRNLYRIGGEEFAVILPGTPADCAVLMAERLRAKISEQSVAGGKLPSVTASFGVAELDDDLTSQDAWLKCADIALYASKNNGRNRVTGNRTISGVTLPDSLLGHHWKKRSQKAT